MSLSKNPSQNKYLGVACDIGTTTICLSLVDLKTKQELSRAACLNSQVKFGEDVISRIDFCLRNKNNLKKLQRALISDINKLIRRLLKQTQAHKNNIREMLLVGNTAMQHLFLGIDPSPLVTPPYKAKQRGLFVRHAGLLQLNINKTAQVKFLPAIAGFVGADILSEIVALKLHKKRGKNLLIDIGTNGEIVFSDNRNITVASCAAGPAFEGRHIKHGMAATDGAIEAVGLKNNRLRLKTVNDKIPQGICGSGLIDALSLMLDLGLIEKSGRINKEFILYESDKKNITVCQQDVRQMQLAKSAIRSGIELMLKNSKKAASIDNIYISGVFGNYINIKNAKAIGLLPKIASKKIIFCGNLALHGAKLALCNIQAFKQMVTLPNSCCHINLSISKHFEKLFTRYLHF